MTSPVQTPFLDRQKQLWKARAEAKQKRLEQRLAQPARPSDDAALRMMWITQALDLVQRRQAEIKYHAALMDACAEHLSVLEMTLLAAAEPTRSPDGAAPPSGETAEPPPATAAANLTAEAGMATAALSDRKHR